MGVQLRIPPKDGMRTFAEQDAEFAKGPKVTPLRGGESYHNYGLAFDVAPLSADRRQTDYGVTAANGRNKKMEQIGKIGKEYGFQWGGDFQKHKDMPHFERSYGRSAKDLRKEMPNGGYPNFSNRPKN